MAKHVGDQIDLTNGTDKTPATHHGLFDPMQVGNITISHRIVMAPLTRLRASDSHIPLDMVRTYYSQRASTPGTLLITEATFISGASRGRGANAPGIFNDEQVAQWKSIVDAVHNQGSFIFCQLWHVGRAARAQELERLGLECVSSSAVPMPGNTSLRPYSGPSTDEYVLPRAMDEVDIQRAIRDFAEAAENAVQGAGFDGVEIHAANGYLIDQFTQSTCNQRTDDWGGSVENRSKFCLEVVRAVCEKIGSHRTGIRLSPFSPFQGMGMQDPEPQFSYLIGQLSQMKLAYLHLIEPRISGNLDRETSARESLDFGFEMWNKAGPVILAGGYTPELARTAVEVTHAGEDVAVAFGRHFISNPDLPYRILNNLDLNKYNRNTFYSVESEEGYIDYEFAI